jgi:serine/threonine protein kinase/tetratricopeptide (TPR) repeat protein
MPLLPGSRLGPYEILSPLGAGGMGVVWRARDDRLGREVAIKVLALDAVGDADRLRRFEVEARSASALNHPAILTVHDFGVEAGVSYLVTELLSGRTLREVLIEGPVPVRRALDWAAQIGGGLAAAHEKGILHRDLKPENLFVTSDGRVKILDFGIAKLTRPMSATGAEANTAIPTGTVAGTLLGTFGYMAPEQLRAEAVDERADLFSLGCVLYELLSGRAAFRRDTSADTFAATLTETPTLPAGLDPRLEDLLSRCLARDRQDRIATARRLVEEIDALREDGGRSITTVRRAPPRKTGTPDSVAVLPFVNESGDAEIEYLSDGVAESLLDALTRLPRLRVLAQSTVMRFKKRLDEPIEVGREVKVGAVVTGRLRQRGDAVRISCELVRVADGARLWGQRYERPLSDLPAICDEIGERLTEHLRGKATPRAKRKVSRAGAHGSPSYQAYLRGRHLWNRWTPDSMRSAVRQYDEAIALEPTNALAWAGLADAWATLGEAKAIAPAEAFPRSKAAALRALELDAQQPEAHVSLGLVRRFWEWDWAGSESAFRRSLELAPGYALAHLWYGYLLSGLGRHEEAIAEMRLAMELDPLSLITLAATGGVHFYARRYEEAVALHRRTLEIDPEFMPARSDLARALAYSGRTAEAVEQYERVIRLAGTSMADPSSGLANALAVAGRIDEARAMLAELSRRRAERYVSSWALASIHAGLGETGEALDWLERAFEERDPALVWLKVHPRFDVLRGESRFESLLARLRF